MSSNLDEFRYFLKVAESLNITRASELLHVTQPTLSYALQRLELNLGEKLFIRLKQGVELTKAGEALIPKAREMLHLWQNLRENLHNQRYSIAIHPSVALYTLGKFLPEIMKSYPALSIQFFHGLSRHMTEKVINWEADLGIVVNPTPHPDLVIKELYKDSVGIFHLKNAPKKLITNPELAQTQYILKNLKGLELTTKNMVISENLEVILKLTSIGLGYGLLPETLAKQNSKLVALKNGLLETYSDSICLIYRREKHQNIMSQNILKIITQSFK